MNQEMTKLENGYSTVEVLHCLLWSKSCKSLQADERALRREVPLYSCICLHLSPLGGHGQS